jgi:hypothetical protein
LWEKSEELGVEVATFAAQCPPQLRRQCQTAGSCERLRNFVNGEVSQGPLIDTLGRARRPKQSIMLAKSTAWRHGLVRTSAKATSISSIRPLRISNWRA